MSWHWTTMAALWGAATGTYGAIVSTQARRDVRWRKAAKQIPTLRPALKELRDTWAGLSTNKRKFNALHNDYPLMGHMDEIKEHLSQVSDRKLQKCLRKVETSYPAVFTVVDQSPEHRKTETLRTAEAAVSAALERLSLIDRKAPP